MDQRLRSVDRKEIDLGPKEDRSTWNDIIGREAKDPFRVMMWHLVKDGEAAADGHDEREEAEDEAVYGSDAVEGGGGECGEE
ncbi:hypothetical protein K7X08_005187 [Anisodus acutangulus]|uniref:Uncharacterized protein n=1 Tax=Anisodus acutangulus TaxID=402998 RepID=A0A9Q1RJE8_9SOLA|nr:hypothetical protein K7X08_005187 [Anisodus acutangulus]